MSCLFHRWSRWEDVDVPIRPTRVPTSPFILPVQVIKQQKRCSRCNLVKTRTT